MSGAAEEGASVGVGDVRSEALAVGCVGVAVGCGEGRACDDVQPASANNVSARDPASGRRRVIGEWERSPSRIVDVTNLLWSKHLTNS